MPNSFKENIRKQLLIAAQDYSSLLSKTIVLESNDFEFQKRYILRFDKTNFLHLTGVLSSLKADEFFKKCLDSSIAVGDFDYDAVKNKTNIKNKLCCLVQLSSMLRKELLVQEQFVKNRIICKIAASNGSFTVGFTGGKRCVYPKTVLNKNRLDKTKPILTIMPKDYLSETNAGGYSQK